MTVKLISTIRLLMLVMLVVTLGGPVLVARAAGDTWTVNAALADDSNCTLAVRQCRTIQAAVTAAGNGDTIVILPGTYTGTVNIESRSNLRLQGAASGTALLQPAATLPWNVLTYGTGRQTAVRIVNSTDIVIDAITLDLDTVKANNVYGILVWNSTGALAHSVLRNNLVADASGGYYEGSVYIRAVVAPYSSSSRAVYRITDSTFQDIGRVSVLMHDWVDVTLARNTIYRTVDDFGYGMEVGSTSVASVIGNTVYGFDTPALSDGSNSAGIYIENAFTASIGWPAVAKNVTLANNEVYNNQSGLWIGNEYAGFAGNVDIGVTLVNNRVHDNAEIGIYITDEGRSLGSSVTVTGYGNQVTNNEVGYDIYTKGNGEVHVALSQDRIAGNTGASGGGVKVEHNGSVGSSLYDVSITASEISGNSPFGVEAMSGISVAAPRNWWGSASGPGGSNNGTSGSVTTTPYAAALLASTTASTHEIGETGTLDTGVTAAGLYGAQLQVNYDSAILNWSSGTANDVLSASPPWAWDIIQENFVAVTGGRRLSGSMSGARQNVGANLTGESIATWRYTCSTVGTSSLLYGATPGTGTLLSDIDGFDIPVAFVGDSITCVATTGSLQGTIQLQGRTLGAPYPAGWNDTVVTLTCASGDCTGSGPYIFVTGVNGAYQLIKSGAGTGVMQGTYSATATRRAYLSASKTGIVIGSSTLTLPTPKLLGGDVYADNSVNAGDLAVVGGAYGNAVPADTGGDINGDAVVNIFDLVLVGGNYGLTGSVWP